MRTHACEPAYSFARRVPELEPRSQRTSWVSHTAAGHAVTGGRRFRSWRQRDCRAVRRRRRRRTPPIHPISAPTNTVPAPIDGLGSSRMVLPATRRERDGTREHDRKKNGVHMSNVIDVEGPANWTLAYPPEWGRGRFLRIRGLLSITEMNDCDGTPSTREACSRCATRLRESVPEAPAPDAARRARTVAVPPAPAPAACRRARQTLGMTRRRTTDNAPLP